MMRALGTFGIIKPNVRAPLEDLMAFLPPGVGARPVYLDIARGTNAEFADAIAGYEALAALLAGQQCEVIAAVGAPPFMLLGYEREAAVIRGWEQRWQIPIFTAPQNQLHALRALGAARIVGASYFPAAQNAVFAKYFADAGIAVLSMDPFVVPFDQVPNVPSAAVAEYIRTNVRRQHGVDAVYILGSGWQVTEIIAPLEKELGIPVVHPVVALAWELQQRLHLHMPVPGYGRLIADLPERRS